MTQDEFFKRLEELEFINEKGRICLNTSQIKGWPKDLDTENVEITHVQFGEKDAEGIAGFAGGDWQEMTRFTVLVYPTGKCGVIMYNDPSYSLTGKNIVKDVSKLYKEYRKKQDKE